MTELTLMVLSAEPSQEASPQVLVQQGELWRESPPVSGAPGFDLGTQRRRLHELLNSIMAQSAQPQLMPSTRRAIEAESYALYRNLLPEPVRQEIDALATAGADEPPLLRVHVARAYEWIPWELLHDGRDFLGLQLRITRLPLIVHPPVAANGSSHPVRSVRSVLGAHLYEGPDFESWAQTFKDLLPVSVQQHIVPPGAADGALWPGLEVLGGEDDDDGDDILHVTCHGGLKADGDDVYWTLDHQSANVWAYKIDPQQVNRLAWLKTSQPLVFGNACASVEGSQSQLSPSLGTTFYEQGALNFVGTFAAIDRCVALEFARTFYRHLLGANEAPKPIALALWATKQEFAQQDTRDPSYLFYCLYGSPDTRFEPVAAAP